MTKTLRQHLEKLRKVRRQEYHPLIHRIRKKHRISRRTLFYVKEYGPRTNVPRTIIKESVKILLLASIISSFGGLALEHIKAVFVSIIPLVILLPALNDMIGDYGAIVASRFSTMLHEGRVRGKWWNDEGLKKLFIQIFIISVLTTGFSFAIAMAVSSLSGYALNALIVFRVFFIAIADVVLLVSILSLVSVFAGLYFYRKGEDPSNFLIPITTSVADFGNMIILSVLIILLF